MATMTPRTRPRSSIDRTKLQQQAAAIYARKAADVRRKKDKRNYSPEVARLEGLPGPPQSNTNGRIRQKTSGYSDRHDDDDAYNRSVDKEAPIKHSVTSTTYGNVL
jgi:hypothetical protein